MRDRRLGQPSAGESSALAVVSALVVLAIGVLATSVGRLLTSDTIEYV